MAVNRALPGATEPVRPARGAKPTHPARRLSYRTRIAVGRVAGAPEADAAARLRERLAGRQLVFCLTNGRSGSNILADLLACVPGVDARHEPPPSFDTLRRDAARDPGLARAFLLRVKLPAIARSRAPVYAETSHVFGKGYFRPMLSTGIPFDCVLLRRAPRRVALSMLSLGHLPGGDGPARRFLIAPDEAECLPLPDAPLTDYQRLFWHVLEVEARSRLYAEELRARGGRVAETALEDLASPAAFRAVLAALGIEAAWVDDEALAARMSDRVNMKAHKRRGVDIPADELDRQEAALGDMLALSP